MVKNIHLTLLLFLTCFAIKAQNEFITCWETTTANETITIPTFSFSTYNYDVDWGDGNTSTGETGNGVHTYATAGIYTVKITGTFPMIYFNSLGDKDKIVSIDQWGDNVWSSFYFSFAGCSNLQLNAVDAPDLSNGPNLTSAFYQATSFNGDLSGWDVSSVTNMSQMFAGASSFNGNIGSWNVSNVTSMATMFYQASSFNQNLNGWNVSSVTTMRNMFRKASSFNGNISSWNVSSVTTMERMFREASSFNGNLSSWNVGNVTNMSEMFLSAFSFDQNLAGWNVSNVTDLTSMFSGVSLSTSNYDALLQGWEAQTLQPNLNFHGGFSKYCDAQTAHTSLTNSGTNNWSISDGGLDCSEYLPVPDVDPLPNDSLECSIGLPTIPTATDNSGTVTGTSSTVFPISSTGVSVVAWTYTNSYGSVTQQNVVYVTDQVAPVPDVANLPDTISDCVAILPVAPTATDACAGSITGTRLNNSPITTLGTTTITWTYTDADGNSSTQDQDVVIQDVSAPVPDIASLTNLTADCSITPIAPTATDACMGSITGVTSTSFPITALGTTTVTWTYSDFNGNSSSQTQDVFIGDVNPPVADLATLPDLTSSCSLAAPTAPTATDACTGSVTGTTTTTFPITTLGSTTITWTYADADNNTSTQTQNVIVTNEAPVIDDPFLADLSGVCSVAMPSNPPTATDDCSGVITGTTTAVFPITAIGSTTIIWTYTDADNNTSTQTQDVYVVDFDSPVADLASLPDLTGDCSVDMPTAPTATDNCTGLVTGTTTTNFPITTQGITAITWIYADSENNTSTQTQNVIIATPTISSNGDLLTSDETGISYQWVDCDNGNAPISGATSQSYTVTANGNYGVMVDYGNCTSMSECAEVNNVGIKESLFSSVSIYPNPSKGEVTVLVENSTEALSLEVYNTIGELVQTLPVNTGNSQVNLSLSRGIYMVQLGSVTQRVIIQ